MKHSESTDLLGRGRSLPPYCPNPKLLDHYVRLIQVMLELLWWVLSVHTSKKTQIASKILSLVPFTTPDPSHEISLQSVPYFLSNVAHKKNRPTNATENITLLAQEVKTNSHMEHWG